MRWWCWAALLPDVALAGVQVQSTGLSYPTIGAAVAAASPGDTLLIDGVTYVEDLVIDKELTLVGQGQGITRIQGSTALSTIGVSTAAAVTLRDLSIDGSGSRAIDIDAGSLVVERVTIDGGATVGEGGGLRATGAMVALTDTTISFTMAARGGGVSLGSGASLVGTNLVIQGTDATVDGGGIFLSGASMTCDNCRFDATHAIGDGGSIRATGSSVTLSGGRFDNVSAGSDGGAWFVDGGSALTVTDVVVNGATASIAGGVLYAGSSAVIDLWGVVDDSSSAFDGGFLYANGAAGPVIVRRSSLCRTSSASGPLLTADSDVTFENNVVQYGVGDAAVQVTNAHVRAYNNAFLSSDLFGVSSVQGTYAMTNNVFARLSVGTSQAVSTGSATFNLYFENTVADTLGVTGLGNLFGDEPAFVAWSDDGDCTNDVFFPQADSPLRDGGTSSLADGDGTWSDIGPSGGPFGDPALYVDVDGDGTIGFYDCDDANAAANPFEVEACDGFDNDCDGSVDPDGSVGGTLYYLDADGDGVGSGSDFGVLACSQPADRVLITGDCDDANNLVYPGAIEVCSDAGDDRNCDGDPDRNAIDADPWAYDGDLDGYGGMDSEALFCSSPGGGWLFGPAGDCDDDNSTVHPGQPDACDGEDENCSGSEDDAPGWQIWYIDADMDGHGNPNQGMGSCLPVPGRVPLGDDCVDGNAGIYPTATELCDVLDNDCDGVVDNGEPQVPWYRDRDTDGFGDAADTRISYCPPGNGYVLVDGDCEDQDDTVRPDAIEVCDEVDNDCDGNVDLDDDSLTDAVSGYEDFDQDGYGTGPLLETCDGTGLAPVDGDCADGLANKNPGEIEVEGNDVDEDCDGVAQGGHDDVDPKPADPETVACACDAGASPAGHLGWLLGLGVLAASRRRRS